MKNYLILTAIAAAATSMVFSSCEDKKEPVYTAPTEFKLNTPVLANQQYILDKEGVVELTCSQPDYGYAAVTYYTVDVALDETFVDATESTEANYKTLIPVNATNTVLQINSKDLATAICQFKGINAFVDYPEAGVDPVKLYVRAHASLNGVPSSEICSNTIVLASVLACNPYPAVPGQVYIVGALTGWTEPSESNAEFYQNWEIKETGVGTNIYHGSIEIPAGEQYFRFYESLSGWGDNDKLPSFGPYGVDGQNLEITITGTEQVLDAVPGKGCWYTSSSWAGGDVTFTINMTNPQDIKVTVKAGAVIPEAYVYMVGSQAGWAEPSAENAETYEPWRLVDLGITGLYTNTFTLPAGQVYFRFYPELTGWGVTPYSSDANGANVDVTLGTAYSYFMGEGCWVIDSNGGEYVLTLDTVNGTFTATAQ